MAAQNGFDAGPDAPALQPGCNAPGCRGHVSQMGLCLAHFFAWRGGDRTLDAFVEREPAGRGGVDGEKPQSEDGAMNESGETTESGGGDEAACRAPGCTHPVKTRGVCNACYQYWIKHRGATPRGRAIEQAMPPPRTGPAAGAAGPPRRVAAEAIDVFKDGLQGSTFEGNTGGPPLDDAALAEAADVLQQFARAVGVPIQRFEVPEGVAFAAASGIAVLTRDGRIERGCVRVMK